MMLAPTGGASLDTPATTDEARLTRNLLLLIVGLIPVRLLAAAILGRSTDEAILAVKAHHLQLSYFDHPPLASVLVAAAQWLTGSDSTLVTRLPTIALFAGTTWLVFRIGTVLFNPAAGFYGALALTLSPLFSIYFGVFSVTDAPMLFGVAAATLCLCHALFGAERGATLWWLGAGLFTGLALLSKSYSAGLLVPGVLGFLLTTPPHRHWLARPAPYLAAAVTLAVMTPIFVWNAENEWITLSFPGGHPLAGGWDFKPFRILAYLGIQALIMLPGIWAGLVAALAWGLARGPGSERTWFLSLLAAVPMALFLLVRLLSADRKGFHWAAPGYLLLFPVLGLMIESAVRTHWSLMQRLLRIAVATLVLAGAGAVTYVLTGWGQRLIPQFQKSDPLIAGMTDWDDLRNAVARHWLGARADLFFVGTRWEDCAKIEAAVRKMAPLLCFASSPEVFAYLADPRQFLGKDAIIVITREDHEAAAATLAPYFDRIEPSESVVVSHFQTRALLLHLYVGRHLNAVYPWPYGPYRAEAIAQSH